MHHLRRPAAVAAAVLCPVCPVAPCAGEAIFTDQAAATGLEFHHFNGMSGELYFPEMTGAGGALLDYDGDGDLDAYLVQGAMLGEGKGRADAIFPPPPGEFPGDRLFRNDFGLDAAGRARVRFVDVTEVAGIVADGYGMGVTTGDLDGDGWTDLYVTNFGPNQLLRNAGDGTFADVTAASGTGDPRWSVSASFLDFDRDGRQDLFVATYVEYALERDARCYAASTRRDYCGPLTYRPAASALFRNHGGGRFEDVSVASGIAAKRGNALGAIAADLDGDGWTDLYVANDQMENFLWLNQGDGSFREAALLAGVAVNREGKAEASMGVDAGDLDEDGDEDLFLTHLTGETNTLYLNLGASLFEDQTLAAGLGAPSLPFTSFGTAWLDYDNDGHLDLLVASGAVKILESLERAGDPFPLDQTNQLFRGRGDGTFEETTAAAGPAFAAAAVGRGVAVGDVDNDGDSDALVTNNSGAARLLINGVGDRRPWLGLDAGGVSATGPTVEAHCASGRTLHRRSHTDGSYASARDPRLLVGLGGCWVAQEGGEVRELAIRWPRGRSLRWHQPPLGRYAVLSRPGDAGRPGARKAAP